MTDHEPICLAAAASHPSFWKVDVDVHLCLGHRITTNGLTG